MSLKRAVNWSDGLWMDPDRLERLHSCEKGGQSDVNSIRPASYFGSSKMSFDGDDRALALASCRRAVEEKADASGKLAKKDVQRLFECPEFASAVFRLLDHGKKGEIWVNEVTKDVRVSFQGCDASSMDSVMEFAQLFESSLKLSVGDFTDGRAFPSDIQKTLSTPELGSIAFNLMTREGKTKVSVDEVIRFVGNISMESTRQQISREDLSKFCTTFRKCAGSKGHLDKEAFGKMVSSKNKLFIDRAFDIFDRRKNGYICLDEYTETLSQLAGKNTDAAVEFLFRIYDANGDGCLEFDELKEVLKASMAESGLRFDDQDLEDLTDALWEDAGMNKPGNTKRLTYSDLQGQFNKHPSLAIELADSITKWCIPPQHRKQLQKATPKILNPSYVLYYLSANRTMVWFLAAFFSANLICFITRAHAFKDFLENDSSRNYFVMFARANGLCLNFNSVMILIFVLRNTITLMRKMGLVNIFPLDYHVFLHKMTGILIFCQAWFHTIMHLTNFCINVVPDPENFLTVNLENLGADTISDTGYHPPGDCAETDPDCEHKYTAWDWLFTSKPGLFGLMGGWANPTGVALILVLTVMVICSLPCIRRSGHFEIFYFTHLLYFSYFILLIFHAPSCWHWLIGPLIVFGMELVYRLSSMFAGNRGKSVVASGIVLPSTVTGLVVKRPYNFNFSPGDWVFIRIPEIALFEWHPFTISSAPEEKDHFTLHIRGVGGWTKELYNYFEEEARRQKQGQSRKESKRLTQFARSVRRSLKRRLHARQDSTWANIEQEFNSEFPNEDEVETATHIDNLRRKPSVVRYHPTVQYLGNDAEGDLEGGRGQGARGASGAGRRQRRDQSTDDMAMKPRRQEGTALRTPLTIYIDGPFGAPSSNVFRAKHAVLIGTGIGVTPFASILQSIMCKFWENKKTCPNCSHKWSENPDKLFRLTKVDFFWINRDQRSFEWFFHLLSQLEIEQAEKGGAMDRFLDMHMYMTGALQRTDMRAVGLELALDLLHEKEKRDLVTGLKSRTKAGRPHWDSIFRELKSQKKGEITVFYCGNPSLAAILREKCNEFGFKFRKEVF